MKLAFTFTGQLCIHLLPFAQTVKICIISFSYTSICGVKYHTGFPNKEVLCLKEGFP